MIRLRRKIEHPHALAMGLGEAMGLAASILLFAFFASEGELTLVICRYHVGGRSHHPSAALRPEAEEAPFRPTAILLGIA